MIACCGDSSWQGSTQGHWRFPASGLEQGYAYLLSHPGTPCLFYDHLHDRSLAHTLQRLIALRLRAGIHCRSEARARIPPSLLGFISF
jgi:alpha-amylase